MFLKWVYETNRVFISKSAICFTKKLEAQWLKTTFLFEQKSTHTKRPYLLPQHEQSAYFTANKSIYWP